METNKSWQYFKTPIMLKHYALSSDKGASFYNGKIAKDIVDTVQSAARNPVPLI